jgi:hypothetical protein
MCCQYAEKCCQESFVTLSMHSATVNDILPLYHVLGLRSDSAILDNIGVCNISLTLSWYIRVTVAYILLYIQNQYC